MEKTYGGTNDFALKFPGKKQSNPLKNAMMLQKQTAKYARNGWKGAFQGIESLEIPFRRRP
jgi:hypothetical protein